MSKKQDKSSRKADLPDWADEVTPADEVMEKFYAPTGVFRPGPISIVKESAEVSPAFQIEPVEDAADPLPTTEIVVAPENTLHISPEDSFPEEVGFALAAEIGPTPLPSPVGPEEIREGFVPATPLESAARPSPEVEDSADVIPFNSQNILFSEFANRWKRYLYPGQLAVMRALYELTFPHETSECFTRYSELAASTKMSRRNCINVVNSLVERGFVERLEIRNDATGKGILLRVHLDPLG